jgi:hypothetical protein
MSWFVEDSTPVLVWGVIFEAVLIFALVRSGRPWILYIMAGVALVVGGIVWHEKHTVTDSKQIRAVLDDAAAAIVRNDSQTVLQHISPSAGNLRRQAVEISASYKFDDIRLTDVKVVVNRFHNPPTAIADFFVRISGSDRGGNFPFSSVLQQGQVTLQLEQGEWKVTGYSLGSQNRH